MTYKIYPAYGSFYIQFLRKGQWRFYIGKEHIRFNSHTEAYVWLVKEKFNGNHALAALHLWSS